MNTIAYPVRVCKFLHIVIYASPVNTCCRCDSQLLQAQTSRGTGFRARELALLLSGQGLARVKGITRHQLLVDPRIPYTSHNSSACVALSALGDPQAVFDFACDYLLRASAEGSDAGVALLKKNAIPKEVFDWGKQAQKIVLTQEDAKALAATHHIRIAGLTGTGGGIIGARAF